MPHEYLFDVKLFAALRVTADSPEAARKILRERIDCADIRINDPMWEGEALEGEVSLDDDEPELIEIDGNAA